MLLHIPAVLNAPQIAEFQEKLARAEWIDGRETVGIQGAAVKRNQQLADTSALRIELGRAVLAALDRSPLFFAAALPLRIMPPRFNRYAGGDEYGFHIDGAVMRASAAADVRTDLSCTLFLNEPDTYDGGELIIDDGYGHHPVKLPAGDLVLYPASSLHRVAPVPSGVRLAAFFWVQSIVRPLERRSLLFDLDGTIQQLRLNQADPQVVLRLSGLYHNLLRRWADV